MTTTAPYYNPAAQSKLQDATNSIIDVEAAIHGAKSAAVSGWVTAVETELENGLTELAKVRTAVMAATIFFIVVVFAPCHLWAIRHHGGCPDSDRDGDNVLRPLKQFVVG